MSRELQWMALACAISVALGCRSNSLTQTKSRSTQVFASNIAVSDERRLTNSSVAETATPRSDVPIQQVSAEIPSDVSPTQIALELSGNRFCIRDAIETGLSQNPDLIALRHGEGVGTATLGVAQTYPFNPWVQVQATPYQHALTGGPGTTTHYILLMQQIQLAHQQQYREEAACAALNSIRWNVLQAELLNVAQTERLYFSAIYQQGLRDLAELNARNNRQLLEILQSQFEAGQATASDVAIVRLDAKTTQQQLKIAEANLQTSLLDLKRHLGLPSTATFDLDTKVMSWKWRPADSAQMTELAAGRPDVMAARSDAVSARANTNFANAARTPDLQIGPIYLRDDFGVTFLGFRAQMDVPVINNGVPLLRQREAEFCQRMMTSQQLSTRAQLEAEAAANRYERARRIMTETSDTSYAEFPMELQRLEEQFKAGEVDILRVLQARNSLLQNRRAELDVLNELMQAAVAVTAATGSPLEAIAVSEPQNPGAPGH